MQLVELGREYVANNARIQSPETVRLLAGVLGRFNDFLGRPARVGDLTDANLRAYAAHRRAAGKALATIDGELAKLMAVARYAALRGLCQPPLLKAPKSPTPLPVAFLRSQLRALWRAAYRSPTYIGGVPGSIYWPALLDTLWDSGERIRAVYSLERSDLDLAGRWLTFRVRKGRGGAQVKRIRRVTANNLRRLLAAHTKPLPFGVACMGTIYHQFEHLLADAGLPTDRHSKFHCVRKSHASYLHLAGGDARESLGHSSDAVTVRHYLDRRIVGGLSPIRLLFHPLGWLGRIWR